MGLIDADALLETIGDHCVALSCCLTVDEWRGKTEMKQRVIEDIENAPTVNGWISVKDGMPETNDEVLVTYIVNGNQKRRYVECASWFDNDEEGYWSSVWDEYRVKGTRTEVIAWMPMPKPYKPPKEDKNGTD